MCNDFVRLHASVAICALHLLLLVSWLQLQAQTDNATFLGGKEIALFIGNFSHQGTADTLFGVVVHGFQLLPTRISWGMSPFSDSSDNAKRIRRKRRFSSSRIELPKWNNLTVSISIQDVNSDSLPDLIFYLCGQIRIHDDCHDTCRYIAVFAQTGLDSLGIYDMAKIERTFQHAPFFAADVLVQDMLTAPEMREPSGANSYILCPLSINSLQPQDNILPHLTLSSSILSPWVTVYPNPATFSTSVEIRNVMPGTYDVSVLSVNGSLQYRQSVDVDQSGELLRAIPLERIATGYYLVQLKRGSQVVATYPLIVVH